MREQMIAMVSAEQQLVAVPDATTVSDPSTDNHVVCSGACYPHVQVAVRPKLLAAMAAKGDPVFSMNSMFRSSAQQYILRRWYEKGQMTAKCGKYNKKTCNKALCGIPVANRPGTSNHEHGMAAASSGKARCPSS